MALTTCKECKKEVSSNAKTCPHCGVSSPALRTKDAVIGFLTLAFLGLMAVQCASSTDKVSPESKKSADDVQCKQDLQCWGDKHDVAASAYCKASVEKLATYSVRWTDGAFDTKFSHYRWLNKDQGTLTYIGDKIEFQNGFGAYQPHTYECDFQPSGRTVLAVRARAGRL